ncbi:MAG: type IX secretion system membrane protein PorP/SprF [Bacteroidia bacterium]|nr:type IX secretion system membrane protein PorP/SprF [Bacteroidia bacterium]
MKRNHIQLFAVIVYLFFAGEVLVYAQQESLFSQYMFNRLVINPAYAGTKDGLSLTALYRHQWTGFEGAPRTFTFSGHAPIMDRRSGIGGFVIADQYGANSAMAAGVNYAYRINFENSSLAFGVQAAAVQFGVDGTKLTTRQSADRAIPRSSETVIKPDVGAGVFFNTGKFYTGLSISHLVEQDLGFSTAATSQQAKLSRHYYATMGYDIYVSENFVISPSVFGRYTAGAPFQFDLNANFMLLDRFWVGASYRHEDAVIFLAGFHIIPQIRMGYSYDYTISNFRGYNSGTHEIMLSYDLRQAGSSKTKTPRYF